MIFKEPKGKRLFLTNFSEKNPTPGKVNGRSATEFSETNIAPQGLQISYNPAGSVLVTSDTFLVRENLETEALDHLQYQFPFSFQVRHEI